MAGPRGGAPPLGGVLGGGQPWGEREEGEGDGVGVDGGVIGGGNGF